MRQMQGKSLSPVDIHVINYVSRGSCSHRVTSLAVYKSTADVKVIEPRLFGLYRELRKIKQTTSSDVT